MVAASLDISEPALQTHFSEVTLAASHDHGLLHGTDGRVGAMVLWRVIRLDFSNDGLSSQARRTISPTAVWVTSSSFSRMPT